MLNRSTGGADDARPTAVSIEDFQSLIRRMYYKKDVARGVPGTFMWLMEEIGELSSALRETSAGNQAEMSREELAHFGQRRQNLAEEFADVLAWLATIANVVEIDLNAAVREKYGAGCPGCGQFVCTCPDAEKP
jgi:NTP pyrophosphatase (non-canonical NTP hydrolase)